MFTFALLLESLSPGTRDKKLPNDIVPFDKSKAPLMGKGHIQFRAQKRIKHICTLIIFQDLTKLLGVRN